MAHLYEVSLLPPEQQRLVLRKIADDGLTRTELQALIASVKQRAKSASPRRGGRPAGPTQFVKTLIVDDATITIRFRKAWASNQDIVKVLRTALHALAD
jgi:hypothetical protein